jgi:hypothetical protein
MQCSERAKIGDPALREVVGPLFLGFRFILFFPLFTLDPSTSHHSLHLLAVPP